MAAKAQIFETLLTTQQAAGVILSGGKVYFYEPGTTTAKSIYTTRNKVTAAANPYTLSSNGTAEIYGDGLYDVSLCDSTGAQIALWEDIQLATEDSTVYYVSQYDSFAAAVASISTARATLVIDYDTTVTADLTIPSTCDLRVINGSQITISANKTLTINGNFDANLSQCFSGTGAVAGLHTSRPDWFGTNTTPGVTDMRDACQKAADSLTSTGTLMLSDTVYALATYASFTLGTYETPSTCIKLTGNKSLVGTGNSELKITVDNTALVSAVTLVGSYETDNTGIAFGPSNSVVTGVKFTGTDTATDATTQSGGGIRVYLGTDVKIYDNYFYQLRGIPIQIKEPIAFGAPFYALSIQSYGNYIDDCHGDGIYFRFCNNSTINNNTIKNTGYTDAIIFEGCKTSDVTNNYVYRPTAVTGQQGRGIVVTDASDDCVISGNNVTVNTANNCIYIIGSVRCVVTNNICKSEAGTYAGISLMIDGGVVNLYTLVHGNHFYGCSPCIRVAAHYNQISNNVANNSNFGLYVDGGNYNVVRDNDISAAGGGIVLKGFDGRSNPDYTVVLNNKCTVAMLDDGTNTTNRGNKFSTGPINGTAVLVGGTVTVNTAEIVGVAGDLPNEYVILSRTVTGGTPGHLSVGTITAGASFVINSSSATDTSTIYWEIQH